MNSPSPSFCPPVVVGTSNDEGVMDDESGGGGGGAGRRQGARGKAREGRGGMGGTTETPLGKSAIDFLNHLGLSSIHPLCDDVAIHRDIDIRRSRHNRRQSRRDEERDGVDGTRRVREDDIGVHPSVSNFADSGIVYELPHRTTLHPAYRHPPPPPTLRCATVL